MQKASKHELVKKLVAIILMATSSLWLNVHVNYLKKQRLILLCFLIFFFSSPAFSMCDKTKRNFFSSLAEKERHYWRRLFLNLYAECVQRKGICYSLILEIVLPESRSHLVLFRVARINLKDNAIAWFCSFVRLFLNKF